MRADSPPRTIPRCPLPLVVLVLLRLGGREELERERRLDLAAELIARERQQLGLLERDLAAADAGEQRVREADRPAEPVGVTRIALTANVNW